MNRIVVGVGEYAVSNIMSESIKTYALGSCIAVVIFDNIKKVAGMVHVALPESKIDINRASELPGYFADTGIPLLVDEVKKKGATHFNKNLTVKLIGGAQISDPNNTFNIGRRNAMAINKILWKLGMGPKATDIGKNFSRTVEIDVNSCSVIINNATGKKWMI